MLSFSILQLRVPKPTTMANKEDGQEDYIQKQILQNQEKGRDLQEQLNAIELTMRESVVNQPQTVNASAGGASVLDNELEPEKEKGSDKDKIRKPCTNGHAWCSGDSASGHCSYTAALGRVVNVTGRLPSAPHTPPPVTHATTAPQRVLGQSVSQAQTLIGSVVGVAKQAPVSTPSRNPQLLTPSDFARPNPNQTRGRGRHVTRGNFARPARPTPARRAGVGRGNIPGRNSRRGRNNHQPGPNHPTSRHRQKPCKLSTGFRWYCIASFQVQVIQQVYELLLEQMSAGLALAITVLILLVCVLCK